MKQKEEGMDTSTIIVYEDMEVQDWTTERGVTKLSGVSHRRAAALTIKYYKQTVPLKVDTHLNYKI
jgi:hypothetical protein